MKAKDNFFLFRISPVKSYHRNSMKLHSRKEETETKCLRIVYADMIFAYLSTFIKPTDYLFLLIYSWNNSQIFVLFALFTHCLRGVYALFTQNSRINSCISMYFDGCLHLHLLF